MSGTYYCHECECRRPLTPISTCAFCGCCYVEEIPSVIEEEEDMDEDYTRELDFFYIHEGQEDDEEELLEERCLYEQLSSIYNHPIARTFDSDDRDERQRIDELLSSITDGGEQAREEDIIAYDVHFEQRNHTESATSRFQLPFARIGRLLETLYDTVSDEESDERDDEIHSYNRRSFLDNLADILSDYTQDIETTTQPISSQSLQLVISNLKKRMLLENDPDVEDECIICQDAFGTTLEIFHLPCNHKFHGECITRWLKIKTSCPVCRQNAGNDEEEQPIETDTTTIPLEDDDPMEHLLATAEQVEQDFEYMADQDLIERRDRLQRLRHEIISRRNHWLSSSPTNYQLNAPPPQSYEHELFNHVFTPHQDIDWTAVTASSMEEVD